MNIRNLLSQSKYFIAKIIDFSPNAQMAHASGNPVTDDLFLYFSMLERNVDISIRFIKLKKLKVLSFQTWKNKEINNLS